MRLSIWPVSELRSALPGGDRENIIVLRAYLDASGQKVDSVVVVSGLVGTVRWWAEFETRWQAFLDEFKLDHFHATEFWARQSRPYCNWTDAEHLKAKADICEILRDLKTIGISVALKVSIFNQWRAGLDHYYHPTHIISV